LNPTLQGTAGPRASAGSVLEPLQRGPVIQWYGSGTRPPADTTTSTPAHGAGHLAYHVPAGVDGDQHDASWWLAEVGRFALPGVKVTLVSKRLHVRFPTRDEAAAFAIPVECALTEIYCAMVIASPFARGRV
jgi:hypothetical protein